LTASVCWITDNWSLSIGGCRNPDRHLSDYGVNQALVVNGLMVVGLRLMRSVFSLFVLTTGLLAFAFDRTVANTMNSISIAVGRLFPQWRWPTALPPWSRERFENWLWFVRLWATCVIAIGLFLFFGA
jgi:hypothetical protein